MKELTVIATFLLLPFVCAALPHIRIFPEKDSLIVPAKSPMDDQIKIPEFCWTPDSKQIQVSAIPAKRNWSDYNMKNWMVLMYNIVDHQLDLVKKESMSGSSMKDNCTIALQKTTAGEEGIVLLNRCTGKLRTLPGILAKDSHPTLSPDGKKLAFTSNRTGHMEIFSLALDQPSATPVQLTHNAPYQSLNPDWSKNGKKIVYYLEKGDHHDQIWTMDASGKNAVNVSHDTLHNYFPSWTPKGQILYTSGNKIFIMRADGSNKQALNGISSPMARISPDGKWLAYIQRDEPGIALLYYPSFKPAGILTGAEIKKWLDEKQ